MNNALLSKWMFKMDTGVENMATRILDKKYLKDKSFGQSKARGGSQFWKGLHEVKGWYERGIGWKLGNGRRVRFWHDVRCGECPLKTAFPRLFNINQQLDLSIGKLWDNGWNLSFRRNLGNKEVEEWRELSAHLAEVELSQEDDEAVLKLENKGQHTYKSLYRMMTCGVSKNAGHLGG